MHGRFWQGLFWGTAIGALVGVMISPLACRSRKKPLLERGVDAVQHTTRDLMREAHKTRKRLMKSSL